MTREELIKQIENYFEKNPEEFNNAITELDDHSGYLNDDRCYPMDKLGKFLCEIEPIQIIRMAFYGYDDDSYTTDQYGIKHYGEFNPQCDYFYFNGYGNLVSTNYPNYANYLSDQTIEELLKYRQYVDTISREPELEELFDALENLVDDCKQEEGKNIHAKNDLINNRISDSFGAWLRARVISNETIKAQELAEIKLRYRNKEIPQKSNYDAQIAALGDMPGDIDSSTDLFADSVMERLHAARKNCPDAKVHVGWFLPVEKWIPDCAFTRVDAIIVSDDVLEVITYNRIPVFLETLGEEIVMKIFALGAVEEFGDQYCFEEIKLSIIHERIEPDFEKTLFKDELTAWGDTLTQTI